MGKVEHIARQIDELSREEFAELREWVLERARTALQFTYIACGGKKQGRNR